MGDLRKNILQTDFEGKKLARIYLGEMISCNGKNFPHDVHNAEKTSYTVICQGKNFNFRRLGKNSCLNKSPIPPPPQQSNGQPHRGWGKIRNLTPQQMSSVKKMAGAGSSCAGFLSSVGCKFDAPYINLSTNVCLVSATDVMEHFTFPGNKDFAADDQGAFHVLFMKGLLCLFIVCETMFTIGKSRTISNANDTQAQQVAPNPRGGRFSTEILWSENTDLKFNASNEEEDGSNKQRNRKNITQ